MVSITSDALCDLVPFVQFKKREKHRWKVLPYLACNFTKSNTLPWVFFTFFKLPEWYQIVQSITKNIPCTDLQNFLVERIPNCCQMPNTEPLLYQTEKSSHWTCSIKKAVLKNFAIFT